MKKILNFFAYTIFFVAMLIYFLPKENLYYEVELLAQPFNIIISDEKIHDKGFSLELSDANIYAMDGIKVADVRNVNISFLVLYNHINIEGVELTNSAASFVPTHIESISATYSVLNPLNIRAQARGDFGIAYAKINLKERLIVVTLEPSKLMSTRFKNTMKMLKKSKEGGYTYEQRF